MPNFLEELDQAEETSGDVIEKNELWTIIQQTSVPSNDSEHLYRLYREETYKLTQAFNLTFMVISSLGLILNLVAMVVFVYKLLWSKWYTSLMLLCLGNVLALTGDLLQHIMHVLPTLLAPKTCQLYLFLFQSGTMLSCWTVAVLAVDCMTCFLKQGGTATRAPVINVLIYLPVLIAALVTNLHLFWTIGLEDTVDESCTYNKQDFSSFWQIWWGVEAGLTLAIPLIIVKIAVAKLLLTSNNDTDKGNPEFPDKINQNEVCQFIFFLFIVGVCPAVAYGLYNHYAVHDHSLLYGLNINNAGSVYSTKLTVYICHLLLLCYLSGHFCIFITLSKDFRQAIFCCLERHMASEQDFIYMNITSSLTLDPEKKKVLDKEMILREPSVHSGSSSVTLLQMDLPNHFEKSELDFCFENHVDELADEQINEQKNKQEDEHLNKNVHNSPNQQDMKEQTDGKSLTSNTDNTELNTNVNFNNNSTEKNSPKGESKCDVMVHVQNDSSSNEIGNRSLLEEMTSHFVLLNDMNKWTSGFEEMVTYC